MSVVRKELATDLAVGLALFIIAGAFALAGGWDLVEDSWLMQVTNRIMSGEALYRDVYMHVTPLSIYLLALPATVFGPQILILRIEIALTFAAIAVTACHINQQLGAAKRYPPLLILALFVFASPARLGLVAHYNNVSNFFFLLAFSLWLSWRATQRVGFMLGAGAALGACFAAKQSWGVYGAIALTVSTIAVVRAEGWSATRAFQLLLQAGAAFIAVVFVAILPVIISGALPDMIAIAFFGHRTYLAIGGMPYIKPILSLKTAVANPLGLGVLRFLNRALPFFLPFGAGPLLVAKLLRDTRQERPLTIAVGAFTIAALAFLYPRADAEHMLFTTPMLILALAFSWRSMGWSTRSSSARALAWTSFAVIVAAAALITRRAINRAISPDYVWSSLPHFRGPLIPRVTHDGLKRNLPGIATLPRDGRTFFLGPYASFYYLAGDVHNPSRYDYPNVVALRESGVAEIISEIRDGRISAVCVDRGGDLQLKAYDLVRYVEHNMVRVPVPDFCEQYVRPH